jgi:hypothetical protein
MSINDTCLLFCLFELLFKNLKWAWVNRYFAIENLFQSAHAEIWRIILTMQLFVGKLANQRWENELVNDNFIVP